MKKIKALISLCLLVFVITSSFVPAKAEELIKVRVGYLPNLWFFHPVIIKGEGWDKEMGLDFELTRFPGPPTESQAFASGFLDIMYNNTEYILCSADCSLHKSKTLNRGPAEKTSV